MSGRRVQSPLGLAMIDERDRLQLANPAFCHYVGLPLEGVEGLRLADVLAPGQGAKLRDKHR